MTRLTFYSGLLLLYLLCAGALSFRCVPGHPGFIIGNCVGQVLTVVLLACLFWLPCWKFNSWSQGQGDASSRRKFILIGATTLECLGLLGQLFARPT